MLVNPHDGWVTIKIDDFQDRASYLTDVPIDILNALIDSYVSYRPATIKFDAEGWDYIVVIDMCCLYIIDYPYRTDDEYLNSDDDKQVLTIVEIDRDDIAKEVISDIERNYDKWIHWIYYINENSITERKQYLDLKLQKLKDLVAKN